MTNYDQNGLLTQTLEEKAPMTNAVRTHLLAALAADLVGPFDPARPDEPHGLSRPTRGA